MNSEMVIILIAVYYKKNIVNYRCIMDAYYCDVFISIALASRTPATHPAISILSMYLIYELLYKPGLCPN